MLTFRRSTLFSPRLYLGFLALELGCAVFGNRYLTAWNACLLGLGLVAVVYWLSTPLTCLAPPPQRWLRRAALLFPAYVALQLLPLPFFLLRIVSPERARLLDSLRPLTQPAAFAPLSVNPAVTFEFFLRIVAYTLTFLLLRDIAWRFWEERRWAPAIPLIAVALMQAGLGIYQNATNQVEVHGTYTNRNHFAGLMEMALPMAAAYALALFNGEQLRPSSPVLRACKACAALSAAALLLVGLLASLSKMGFAAGLCGGAVMGALALGSSLRGAKRVWAIACLAALLFLGFIFLPSDKLVQSFGESLSSEGPVNLEGRWPIWGNTLHLIAAYPLFGSGLGTFSSVFLKFQTAVVEGVFNYAHNDYLEFAAELGGGFLILVAILSAVFWSALHAATHGPDRNTRYLGLGCAGALTAIFIHSFVDFNMYTRANPMFLAWICGIAACLPDVTSAQAPDRPVLSRVFCRRLSIALGCLLIAYAPAWIVFETSFLNNPRAERLFCRFGICDIDSALAALTPPGMDQTGAPVAGLLEAVRRDPASQHRWYDFCYALMKSGRVEQAGYCLSHVLALGPENPPMLLLVADLYAGIQEKSRALELASHALTKTSLYDTWVFDWFKTMHFPAAGILPALPPGPRAPEAWLRYLMAGGNRADASLAWNWMLSHRYASDPLAYEYVDFLFRNKDYQAAAQSWAAYLGDRRNGYLESNWIYNGDFESPLSASPFDWKLERLPGVEVAQDSSVAHTGSQSLRIRFGGEENLDYHGVSQAVFVSPGTYRFEAFIRTQEITTSQGIGFGISDSAHLSIQTEQLTGTNGWKKIDQLVRVSPETKSLTIQVIRQPVKFKFDDRIRGTAWIDSVRLSKLP